MVKHIEAYKPEQVYHKAFRFRNISGKIPEVSISKTLKLLNRID